MAGDPPVIVSIATIPSRIAKIRPTLESLLAGHRPPDRILVNTPTFCRYENSGYEIPGFLTDPAQFGGKVRHVVSPIDWGPGTKILGPVPHLPAESILVIADDDIVYHREFLQRLVAAQMASRNSSFSFFVYRAMGLSIATGCDGLSVWSPHLDGIEAFARRHVADTTLLYHDDVWIAFFLMTRGVRVRQLPVPADAELVYQQVLPNNVLSGQTGAMQRETIAATHLPRLLKEVELPVLTKARLLGLRAYDETVDLKRRVVNKAARLMGAQPAA
jgi:hypothetical protein